MFRWGEEGLKSAVVINALQCVGEMQVQEILRESLSI